MKRVQERGYAVANLTALPRSEPLTEAGGNHSVFLCVLEAECAPGVFSRDSFPVTLET